MRRHNSGYHSPLRRGHGGRGRSPPRRSYGGRREQNNGSLLVRNIPMNCRPEDLRMPFERYGPIRDVYMPKDYYTGEPRGFAFVQFVDPVDASEAQYYMNQKQFAGREITVVAAETRKKPDEMRHSDRVRPSGYDGRRSHGRHRSRSLSRSRSPRSCYPRERSRSRSSAPRRSSRVVDSASPRRRESDRPRSPRGHEDDHGRRSYSPSHSDADRNRSDNGHHKKASREREETREGSHSRYRSPPPRRSSDSPPGSRSTAADDRFLIAPTAASAKIVLNPVRPSLPLTDCSFNSRKLVESCESMGRRDWSSLPSDLALLILRLLPVTDYLQFGLVCVSWKHLVSSRPVPPAPQPPLLMLPDLSRGYYARVLFNPFTNKEQCRVLLPKYEWYRGSTSDGYIILQLGSELLVLNPLTGSRIPLPSLGFNWSITSFATSPRPDAVFAICYGTSENQCLTFCKPGDASWTDLVPSLKLRDIVLYKDRLYGLTGTGALCAFDLKKNSQCSMMTSAHIDTGNVNHMCLVKSSNDELFKVCHRADQYTVFKLDSTIKNWCRVRSLGDNVIMLLDWSGPPQCMCVSARDFPELGGNCIYSVPYSTNKIGVRVFNLGDESNEEYFQPLCSGKISYWFTPCLAI